MKITALERRRYLAVLRSPLVTSAGVVRVREGVLVRVRGNDGLVGYGEASPAGWVGGETLDTVEQALDGVALAGALGRVTADGALEVAEWEALLAETRARSPAAAFALDTAWCDLNAMARNVSVCALLSGGEPCAQPLAALVDATSPPFVGREIKALQSQGFNAFKLKIGASSLRDDVACLQAAREAAPQAQLRLDANRAWQEPAALRALEALAPFGPDYIEEPLRAAEPAALRRLSERTGVAVAVDESIGGIGDLQRYLAARAVSVIVVKPARVGGLRIARELALAALASGLQVVVTDSLETQVGQLAALHLAASLPAPRMATGLAGAWLLAEPSLLIEGRARPPAEHAFTRPGLGVAGGLQDAAR